MINQRLVLIAAITAVALAGCGSSAGPGTVAQVSTSRHATTTAEVTTSATATQTKTKDGPAAPATTSTPATAAHTSTPATAAHTDTTTRRSDPSASTTTASRKGTTSTEPVVKGRSLPGRVVARRERARKRALLAKQHSHAHGSPAGSGGTVAPEPTTAGISGPTPDACLSEVGLADAHEWQAGEWVGTVPVVNVDVFVQGPYTGKSAAVLSSEQMQGIETTAAGGLYMVSAPLKANDSAQVKAVAGCLDATSGHGTLAG